jgi:hypothetical protein
LRSPIRTEKHDMSRFRTLVRSLFCLVSVWAAWLAVAVQAWAQQTGGGGGEDRGAKPWVLPYALVLLGVGLGMLLICRPSKRRERAKPEQYEGQDAAGDADESAAG